MNIILLSGGSGKRLWPLSNDTRSKQFLRLLRNDEGDLESMVQRVYHQIQQANIGADITIATSKSQVNSIENQLLDKVEIVVEPERRDTFPAILLSCAYLYYEKKIDLSHPIIVLPCDPYTNIGYFQTLQNMSDAIAEGRADIALMGVEPTYPSAKYGYIIPKINTCNSGLLPVDSFREKPTEEQAKKLLSKNALWNCGVFAFRLGYVINLLHKYFTCTSYKETFENYAKLPKISFDYEVVEKCSRVCVIPYKGIWKDLGTWNTLTEQMSEVSIGNVIVGEDTAQTHIINELDIPLVALGTQNMVIVASHDGILVSDKHKSSYLKPYVEQIDQRPMYEERRWGEYKVLDHVLYSDGAKSLVKRYHIKAGETLSGYQEEIHSRTWTVLSGNGLLQWEGTKRQLIKGSAIDIPMNKEYRLTATTEMEFIEIRIH